MPSLPLTVGAVGNVLIAQGGYSRRYEYEVEPERTWNGDLHAMVTPYRGLVKVWSLRTPPMERADAEALVTALRAAGTVTVDGDIVGTSVACHVQSPSMAFLPGTSLYATVSFELRETKTVGGDRREYLQVLMAGPTGALVDVTRWFVQGNVSRSVEQMSTTAGLTFLRETYEGTNNPLITGDSGKFGLARECRIRFAWHATGDTLSESDWWYPFSGTVHAFGVGGKRPVMSFKGRDHTGRIVKHMIDTVRRYGSTTATSPQVVQALLNAELPTLGYTVTNPDSIDQNILPYDQKRERLHSAIQAVADVSGAMFQQFTDSDGEPEFRLWQPDVSKTTPDVTFTEGEYFEVTALEKSLDEVRNRALGILRDENHENGLFQVARTAVESDDPEEQTIIIDLQNNPLILTAQDAGRFLDAILAETTFATLSHRVRMPPRQEIEIGQLARWPADNVTYSSPQDAGIVAFDLSLSPGGNEMTVEGAVKVRGSRFRWDTYEYNYRRSQETDPSVGPVTIGIDDIAGRFTTSAGSANYTEESDGPSSLGGYGSTTAIPLSLDALFRLVTEAEKASGLTLYRTIWFPNVSEDLIEWPNVIVYFNKLGTGGIAWAMASDPVGIIDYDGTDQSYISASESAAPDPGGGDALVWVSPDDALHADTLDIGTVEAQQGFFLHLRLTVDAGATGQITDETVIAKELSPA